MTLEDRIKIAGKATTGFDYLRIILSLAVVFWHSIGIGTASADQPIWEGPFRFLPAAIVPLFFALSGFLVASSLVRSRLHHFVLLRVLRLVPALAVETTLCAVLLGLTLSTFTWHDYLSDPLFAKYFLNIVGDIHYHLPGVFQTNPEPYTVNAQLWTIPYELDCYFALILLTLFKFVRFRVAFVLFVIASVLTLTVRAFLRSATLPPGPGGSVAVLFFLAGVTFYLYRDRVSYSLLWGVISGVLTAVLLSFPVTAPLAAVPGAYLTVWLGLMSPPRIPFGDLSYGVYLFHFPIQQSIIQLFPWLQSWWQLTLVSLPPTLVCAFVSWTVIEQPILNRKWRFLAWLDQQFAGFKLSRPGLTGHATPRNEPERKL